jgi:hypothetical protein
MQASVLTSTVSVHKRDEFKQLTPIKNPALLNDNFALKLGQITFK